MSRQRLDERTEIVQEHQQYSGPHMRLLECWLPLAQTLNQRCGWGHDAAALEALILAAAPALAQAASAPEAYGILWSYHLMRATRQR